MKRLLFILLLAAGTAYGQINNPPTSADIVDATAVGRTLLNSTNSWLTNTGAPIFNYTATNARLNATIADTNFNFGNVGGVLEVEANNNHAIIARSSEATDGAAFYGRSASGAPAGKFVQTNAFVSPTVSIWRTAGNYTNAATLLVHGDPVDPTAKAISVINGTNEVYFVRFNGQTSDRHWLGNSTTNPSGAGEGQLYFNTSNSTVRIFANGQWRSLN
jgi:hypothetical protein